MPENSYNFKKDSSDGNCSFRLLWFSAKLKGVLCHYYVLFNSKVDREVQDRLFINKLKQLISNNLYCKIFDHFRRDSKCLQLLFQ